MKEKYIENTFHHYLPANKPQETFKFEDGSTDNYIYYVAEKMANINLESNHKSPDKRKSYLSIDVEQLLEKLELENKLKEREELEKLGDQYRQTIEFQN